MSMSMPISIPTFNAMQLPIISTIRSIAMMPRSHCMRAVTRSPLMPLSRTMQRSVQANPRSCMSHTGAMRWQWHRAMSTCAMSKWMPCKKASTSVSTSCYSSAAFVYSHSRPLSTNSSPSASSTPSSSSPSSPSNTESHGIRPVTKEDWKEHQSLNQKPLAYWLFLVSGMVFGIVVVGGLTRLTRSGLSIVEWKPHQGRPPMNEKEWEEEFEKYKQFPEYQRVNTEMALSEFKFIYMMEFSHRHIGRLIGIVFAVPLIYFGVRKQLTAPLLKRLSLLFVFGGTQGAIGWWMVKSGLDNPIETTSSHLHVSPYRLATHLLCAFGIYSVVLSTALHMYYPQPSTLEQLHKNPDVRKLRKLGLLTAGLVALTIASGAFVAGNEAGLIYNEFPLMGGRIIPSDIISPYISPAWRNLFENPTTVQFDHRVLAILTFVSANVLAYRAKRLPVGRPIQILAHCVSGMTILQASIGVTTLLMHVPIPLASLHQAGAMSVLTFLVIFLHFLGGPRVSYLTKAAAVKNMVNRSALNNAVKSSIFLMAAGNNSSVLDWKSRSQNVFL